MDQLTLGVIARSRKENERRLPIHPRHLDRIPPDLRQRIFLEHGYGEPFGVADSVLAPQVAGLMSHRELIADCDAILLPKPLADDVAELREGQILWGWPHCVQDPELTQLAIQRRLTLIAFEAMNHWSASGSYKLHVFHKNNELAGYCAVLHGLQCAGTTGDYGRRLRAVVIGFGATARGAVTALKAQGIREVTILTNREVTAVSAPIHSADILRFHHDDAVPRRSRVVTDSGDVSLGEVLAGYDIIVNCVLQDPNAPLLFLTDEDASLLLPGTLIVDVSCDEGMGFTWARPTTFDEPTFVVGDSVLYYGVDHTPSYLWDAASWEVSEALLPFLPAVLAGPSGWDTDQTIRRAIEIRAGVVQNPDILTFQNRSPDYPHVVR